MWWYSLNRLPESLFDHPGQIVADLHGGKLSIGKADFRITPFPTFAIDKELGFVRPTAVFENGIAWGIQVPLWLLFLCAALPTAWSWYRHCKKAREGYCPVCGYNLTGNESGICSECGTKIVDPSGPSAVPPSKAES